MERAYEKSISIVALFLRLMHFIRKLLQCTTMLRLPLALHDPPTGVGPFSMDDIGGSTAASTDDAVATLHYAGMLWDSIDLRWRVTSGCMAR